MPSIRLTRSVARDALGKQSPLRQLRSALLVITQVILTTACGQELDQPREVTDDTANLAHAGEASAGAAAPQAGASRGRQAKRWHEPVSIESFSGDAREPSIAVNARGDALLGWAQTDRLGVHAVIAHAMAGRAFGEPERLPATVGEAREVHVALADDGRGLLVWDEQRNPGSISGLSATWSEADGAGEIQELLNFDPTIAVTYGPRFASYRDGRAIALWGYSVGRGVAIQAFRYEVASGWGPLTKLQLDPAPTRQPIITEADVALGARTVAFTTFSSYGVPWANRSTAQDPVGLATALDAADSGGAATPRVAADARGNALAVWTRYEQSRQRTMAARYVNGTWSAPVSLQSTDVSSETSSFVDPSRTHALFTAFGTPCAAFIRPEPDHSDVWASCYFGRRWTQPVRIDADESGQSRSLQVAADGGGGWVAVWSRADGSAEHVFANRYAIGQGWSGATRLDAEGGNSSSPVVGLDRRGNGFAAWTQTLAYTRLLVSRLE